MRVIFAVVEGPHLGRTFTFTGHETFVVGRSKRAHFRLPEKDDFFSRIHFLVEVNPPVCRLMDMGSTNGTYVNNNRVVVADLANGDLIQGGQTVLRVSVEDVDSEPPTRQAEALVAVSSTPPDPAVPRTDKPSPHPTFSYCLSPLPPALEGAASCCACAAPAATLAPTGRWPLCRACYDETRNQDQRIPGYLVVRELGHGGMGVVYLALRTADGGVVALKTIQPARDAPEAEVQRFLREAKVLQQLSHPNIVAFREMGEADGRLFFAMDLIRGKDAAALLREAGPMPVGRAVGLVCQLLAALEYAHSRGFVHRDIKPANLLVTHEADREKALLVDFGLVRVYQESRLSGLSMSGQIAGTAAFMPPEQVTNFRGARPTADQYSAAATLYNLLTDRYVYDFPTAFFERLLLILEKTPVPIRTRRPDVPEELARVIHRALAREPEDRFPDVATMRTALLAAQQMP